MTEPMPPKRSTPPSGGGGAMSEKLWGLPTWGWVAIAAAGGVVMLLWLQNRKKGDSAPQQTLTTPSADSADVQDLQSQLATIEAQIRDLQGGGSTPAPGDDGSGTTPPVPATDDGSVVGGRNVQGYFEAWNRHDPTLHLTWAKFIALNPGALTNVNTFGNKTGADDAFIRDAKYRLK